MSEVLLITICVALMGYLGFYWIGVTATMKAEIRHKRMTRHLDWQNPQKKAPRRKQGLIRS